MDRQQLDALLEDYDMSLLLMDGFDDALIGFGQRVGEDYIAVYNRNKMIEILVEQDMTVGEADEYISFNCEGAWVGPTTPLIITLVEDLDL